MRLATFNVGATRTIGALVRDCYVDLPALTGGQLPADMIVFLRLGADGMKRAREALAGIEGRLQPVNDQVPALLEALPRTCWSTKG